MARETVAIGTDLEIEITFGQFHDGSTPQFGNVVDLTAIAGDWRVTEEAKEADTTGRSKRRRTRVGVISRDLELENLVPISGLIYETVSAQTFSAVGYYVRVRSKVHPNLATPQEWIGWVRQWRYDSKGDDSSQMERVQINLDPDINGA